MVREAKEILKGEITKLRVAPWQMANCNCMDIKGEPGNNGKGSIEDEADTAQ